MKKNKTAPAASAQLQEIVALARRQIQIEETIADISTSLKDLNDMLTRIQMEDLPAAMAEAGLKEFTLDTGEEIIIRPDFAVTLEERNKPAAFDWLEEHGFGSLIKTVVTTEFGKGELAKAQKLLIVLTGKKLNTSLKRDVHWQTLKAFIKEQDEQKDKVPKKDRIPMDIFGAHPLTKSIIKIKVMKTK